MSLLVLNARFVGTAALLDVRVRAQHIVQIAPGLTPLPGEQCIDAAGARIAPPLQDDHLHLEAWLRAQRSLAFPPRGLGPAGPCRASL